MIALEFMSLPPVEMQAAIDAMPMPARVELARSLEGYAAGAAFAAGYVQNRCLCDYDMGHEQAVKDANAARRTTWQALGYSTVPNIIV